MPRAAPILSAFNGGQYSRTIDGRVDFDKYGSGCKLLQNFVALIQGPAQRRGGTAFVTEQKNSANRVWGIRFEFAFDQAFVIEFGDNYCRFLTTKNEFGGDAHLYQSPGSVAAWSALTNYNIGDLVSSGGVSYYCILAHINQIPPNATYWYPMPAFIYEIPSPYDLADLTNPDGTCALKTEQSGDVLYICNQYGTYPPMKLTRFADNQWIFSEYRPNQGPFENRQISAVTVQATAVSGTGIQVNAVGDLIFAATDVGRLIRIQSDNFSSTQWETGRAYALFDEVRSNGKTYRAINAATSGVSAPSHESGTAPDGVGGVIWQYIHSGYGVVRITQFNTGFQVLGDVVEDDANGLLELPADVVSATTRRWRLGAWSAASGYPRTLAFWKFRLFMFTRQGVYASVPNDFENHAPDFFGRVEIDNALNESLQSQDVTDILWAAGATKLVLGTTGGEFIGDKITDSEPVGPGNFELARSSKRRVRAVQPIAAGTSLLYVQRAGRKLLTMDFDIELDVFSSNDLAVLSNRITRGGIIDMAYQSEPNSILWVVLTDGRLIGFTYDLNQNVSGWHVHPIGGDGAVESIAVIPSEDGSRDELWMSVRRTIGGSTKRFWEYVKKPWEGPDDDGGEGDSQVFDAFYVDSGVTGYGGFGPSSQAKIVGVTYLSGEVASLQVQFSPGSFAVVFTPFYVGKTVVFYLDSGARYTALITGFIAGDEVEVTLSADAPEEVREFTSDWSILADVYSGFDHLIGETVQVLADGAVHPDCVVDAMGQITLQLPAGVIHAGYGFDSRLVPMRIEAGSADGTSQGKIKRVNEIILRLVDTLGGKVGMFGGRLDSISRRAPSTPMGAPPPIFSEDVRVSMPGLYERDGLIEVRQDQPLPMMVAALMVQMKTYDP